MAEQIVELKNITKIFPGVVALDNMSMEIDKGEIHGLIGENGAGKSTLIKVLTGVHSPDKGEILFEGKPQKFKNPQMARNVGIACVYQELNICKDSTVIDNLFLGGYVKKRNGFLDKSKMLKKTQEILELLGQSFSPNTVCGKLGIGQQQIVEIGRAILTEAKVIILDEPTSSLGETETENLFRVVKRLREKKGISFLFVSHKLEELFTLCDSVTVMRDSKHIVTKPTTELTNDSLIQYMVGRTLENLYPKKPVKSGETLLEVKNMTREGEYYDVSFKAKRGEILGFSGLVGAGRSELFRSIFGATKPDKGEVYISGKQCVINNPGDAIKHGIAFLTEDRKSEGLTLSFTVKENMVAVSRANYRKGILLDFAGIDKMVDEQIDRLNIKVSSANQVAAELSGGNQQKVVIGKWTAADAEIYIFDEPTKGIDVGAKVEVYNVMNRLVAENKCVIMISSELPEILGMSDRVIVMRSGYVMKEINRESELFNQNDIMKAAWGVSL